ncbi:UDP-N-acetylglucosamine 1-carboxyvinyltransferase [Marvinbryantia formatexigens DSM 14469]|uniref:UDP-N-acetylglucosamine 1-carboxyvinyltransferase n=1 Tax=Marvinbryantia formatexigens DSM 14469 TaxID=478749 RepID=C6LH08_9FIRM|nr:UDP-N-acetylglucosamine 1-carboxyvinyltransferase [Marvinbryantia formatexigens]EET60067.1 UDP-N-acetylglucosamine 1-carboxyvinyltransferase [Marvinbryantia formatexigens DSM 14469]UWO23860.1 UDP-N-acetylglucosamine 1-carboxyvinyltransferase [Marvinbryantia formatexigens DSM 14469]SDG50837.1 UDP-N-acetylglucosamine 1-carboxyvinyltransferase [Marvinbryantia formatexigens]
MNRIQTRGNIPLCGEVTIQGAKNAALPLMAAAVLHRGTTVLHRCPQILDVEYMSGILRGLGCTVRREGQTLIIDAREISDFCVAAQPATCLRASVLLMGSLLGRCGCARLPYPGGCTIGERPIDLHLQVFERMGAQILPEEEGIGVYAGKGCAKEPGCARADGAAPPDRARLQGCSLRLSFPSVGATENAILGAVLAEGTTELDGCATEPEIAELCRFLNQKGAKIEGVGRQRLVITGVTCLQDSQYTLMPDRIVAGTYLLAAAGTRGRISVRGVCPEHLGALTEVLQKSGAKLKTGRDVICMDAREAYLPVSSVRTEPYPGFPTDLQSQLMVFLTGARGVSTLEERLFESRFLIAGELQKMGAELAIHGRLAVIKGTCGLRGAIVQARELRGGAALVAAGLMAEGETLVLDSHFIKRGYEDICRDLSGLGADIKEL